MTKAERRRRSRQRAKERERQGTPEPVAMAPGGELPSSPPAAAPAVVPSVVLATESPFITGPVVSMGKRPSGTAPVRAERIELPPGSTLDEPLDGEFDEPTDGDADEDDDQEDDDDDDDNLDEGEEGDDGDDEDDGEDGDEDDDPEMDAVFNAACGAVEQGDAFSWNELIQTLCETEVTDPRLGLLFALLVDQDEAGLPLKLTGERVLKVLTDLQLEELVAEAREVASIAPGDLEDTPEERVVVRTNARELREQAKTELASGSRSTRPLKASQVKARQTALGTTVAAPAVSRAGAGRTAR